MPRWLSYLWPGPSDLSLEDWPTFCGAGEGVGDWLVPDSIYGARICPACFLHDIEWATAGGSFTEFWDINSRFRMNLKGLTRAQLPKRLWIPAWIRIHTYHLAVCTFGWPIYKAGSMPLPGMVVYKNQTVKSRLRKLAKALLHIE